MLFKKDELKLLWPFYLYSLIFGLSFLIMPFLIIYLRDIGFSYLQISITSLTFGVATLLFEIPTGAMADSFSRKYSVIIGFIIVAISVCLIPLVESFFLILPFWALAAIGLTFTSGAEEAWIIDNLNHKGRKDLYHEYFIKGTSISGFGMIFSPILGAILTKYYSMKLLWFIFGFGFLINCFILGFFTKEYYKPKRTNFTSAIKKSFANASDGLKFAVSHKTVSVLIIGYVLTYLIFMAKEGWTPLLVELGLKEYSLGYIYAIISSFIVVVPFLSRLFTKYKLKYVISINLLITMVSSFMIIFVFAPNYQIASVIFILSNVLPHFNRPLLETYFHKFVPKKTRATVSSIKNMAYQFFGAVFAIVGGYLMDIYGPQKVIGWTSLLGVFAIFTYLKLKD